MQQKHPRIVFVDGHNLLWRAAFGFPARVRNSIGTDITPAFGFFALLRAGIRELDEDTTCVVCFDGQHGPQHRKTVEPGYKDNRPTEPIPHMAFLAPIKEGLTYFGIAWCEFDIYEADDVVASLLRGSNRKAAIMSTDKDFYQLLGPDVCVLNTQRRQGGRIISEGDLQTLFGVDPAQWCDFRALTGDSADSIGGVPGVGPKTAARLLQNGFTLEKLFGSDRLTGSKGLVIREKFDTILQNRELMRLNEDLPIAVPIPIECTQLPKAVDAMRAVGLM